MENIKYIIDIKILNIVIDIKNILFKRIALCLLSI